MSHISWEERTVKQQKIYIVYFVDTSCVQINHERVRQYKHSKNKIKNTYVTNDSISEESIKEILEYYSSSCGPFL